MNAEILFNTIYVSVFIGVLALILYLSEGVVNLLYRFSSIFRRWIYDFCEGSIDDNKGGSE